MHSLFQKDYSSWRRRASISIVALVAVLLGGPPAFANPSASEDLGHSVSAAVSESPFFRYQRFERGVLYSSPWGTHAVVGANASVHGRFGGGGGALGYPKGGQVWQSPAFSYQMFERGVVYQSPSGAYAVLGLLNDAHRFHGGGGGRLGYPLADEVKEGPGFWYQRFERGILYSSRWGTHAVFDQVILRVHTVRGGGGGSLGYPTWGEESNGQVSQHFERGTVYGSGGNERVTSLVVLEGTVIVNKSYALPRDYAPGGLTGQTSQAFETMRAEASRQGLTLILRSGYRSYDQQDALYRGYLRMYGQVYADSISARPGHSEHQSGQAIDVNSLTGSFGETPEGRWVAAHAHEYGFIVRYPPGKEHITGYSSEPWHLRLVGTALATSLRRSGETLEEYFGVSSRY